MDWPVRTTTSPSDPTTPQSARPGVGSNEPTPGPASASSALGDPGTTDASDGEPTTESKGAETTTEGEAEGDDSNGGIVVTEGWTEEPWPGNAPLAPADGDEAAGAEVDVVAGVEPELGGEDLGASEEALEPELAEPDDAPAEPEEAGGLIVTFPTPPAEEPLVLGLQFAPMSPSRQAALLFPLALEPLGEAVDDE